jgi:hypothetical protein
MNDERPIAIVERPSHAVQLAAKRLGRLHGSSASILRVLDHHLHRRSALFEATKVARHGSLRPPGCNIGWTHGWNNAAEEQQCGEAAVRLLRIVSPGVQQTGARVSPRPRHAKRQ